MNILLKISYLILLVFVYKFGQARNLVPNPSFEQKTIIMIDSNCIKYSFPYWKSLNKDYGCNITQSSFFDFKEYLPKYITELNNYYENWDYDFGCIKYLENKQNSRIDKNYICFTKFNNNNQLVTVAVDTTNRYYRAKQGNCYIRNIGSFSESLFQVKLREALQKDSCYSFGMYYTFPRYFSKDTSFFRAGKFGAYFTNTDFADKEDDILISSIDYTPQILIDEFDSSALKGWVKYSEIFTAKENSGYMIIGNHQPFNSVDLYSPISFHIDCVKIVKHKCPEIEYGIYDTVQIRPIEGLKEYYNYVNQAELEFINSNPKKAADLYMKAFTYKENPFVMDKTRAFSIVLNSSSDTNLIKNCIIRNWRTFYVDSVPAYITFLKNQYQNIDSGFLYSLIPILDTTSKFNSRNEKLEAEINTMIENDQLVRIEKPLNRKKMGITDSLNFFHLMRLYKKYGSITESNAGVNSMHSISTILFHNHKRINIWYPVMLEQVLKGNYSNKLFVDILTDYYRDIHDNPDKFAYYQGKSLLTKYVVIKLPKEEEKEVNRIRKYLFLEPYQDQEKKKIWSFFNKNDINHEFHFYPLDMHAPPIEFIQESEMDFYLQKESNDINELQKEYGDKLLIFKDFDNDINIE